MKRIRLFLAAAAAPALAASPALAHHVMGGEVPSSFVSGLLSGLGHPIIGVDHLAFVIAMGIAAAFTASRFLSPLAFVVATVAGCLIHIAGIALPLPEIVIAGSIVVLGALILSGRTISQGLYLALFAVAGLFHGWAYGESIVGAESTPLVTYVVGFAAIQYLVAIAVASVVAVLWRATDPAAVKARLAGAVAAGVGAAFLVENIESMLSA
jgi:urease accessory protein